MMFTHASLNNVFIFKTSPKSLKKDIEKTLNESRLTDFYNVKKRTLLKINANYDKVYPGCNVSVWFLDALLFVLKRFGFVDLAVVEGDLKLQPCERTIEIIGVKGVCEKHKVPFFNLDKEARDEDELPLLLYESQIINVPVIHTHTFAVVSCACKNLFGLLPVDREKYHGVLSDKLLELYKRIKPCFTIVDGTVGLDGGSMRMGNPKRLDLIIAGWDALLIDLVVSKLMGFSEDRAPLLKLARERGLLGNPFLVGDFINLNSLPKFNFKYKDSKIAKVDIWLRNSKFTKRFFSFNSIFDRLAHRLRRGLLSLNYSFKKNALLDGDWMDYMEKFTVGDGYEDLSSYRN